MLLYLGNWGYSHFTLPQGLDIVGAWARGPRQSIHEDLALGMIWMRVQQFYRLNSGIVRISLALAQRRDE